MTRAKDLGLHEEIMLLSLREQEGTMEFGTSWSLAVGGAIVAQLMIDGHLAAAVDGKRTFLEVDDATPPTDELLAECLERVRISRRRETVQTWVTRFANTKQLKHRVAVALCRRKILKADEGKVLLFFRRRVYPEVDPKPEKELRERMRRAIFLNGTSVDPRTGVVIALSHGCGILPRIFEKKKLKERKARLDKIMKGDLVGDAAKQAVEAVQAAVLMSVIIPTVITSAATSR